MAQKKKRIQAGRIRPGGYLQKKNTVYQIISIDDTGYELRTITEATGAREILYLQEILQDWENWNYAETREILKAINDRKLVAAYTPPPASLPPAALQKARHQIEIVEGFQAHLQVVQAQLGDCVSITEERARYAEQQGISLATLYNYESRYKASQGDLAAMATERRSTYNKKKLSNADQHFLDMMILQYPNLSTIEILEVARAQLKLRQGLWVDPLKCETVPQDLVVELLNPRIPTEAILANPEKAELLTPVTLPKKTSFYEYYNAFRASPDLGRTVVDARYGEGTWEAQLMVYDTFVHTVTEPLQHVFVDYQVLDIFTVDEDTRQRRDRLYLNMMFDPYHRGVLGASLLYEAPSIESFMSVYQHAIWPKMDHIRLGINGDWKGHGVPASISVDNAWANQSNTVVGLVNDPDIGFDLLFRPIYKGRAGALIERNFGNLALKIKRRLKSAGSILSSHPKDVRNAAKAACLLYSDIYRFLIEEIVVYQNTVHRELGMTPNEKWEEEEREHGILPPPPRTQALERKFWRSLNGTRVIRDKGISLFGMHYASAKLYSLPRVDWVPHETDGRIDQAIHYGIRYNPHDISRIAIFKGSTYLCDARPSELRMANDDYAVVSLAERELAKQLAAQSSSRNATRDWVLYLDELSQTVRQRKDEQRRAHKRQVDQPDAVKPPKNPQNRSNRASEPLSEVTNTNISVISDKALDDFFE